MSGRTYLAIDLKSFYASVECAAMGLDPLTANLVVADASRTEKTICLAVSPALKSIGIPGRPRLFEVNEKVRLHNAERVLRAPGRAFTGESADQKELLSHPELKLSYITATPRMAEYMRVSTEIYQIYLEFVAPEDLYVYSVDEVFIDATDYLRFYGLSAHDLAMKMIRTVLERTGITATAGIGPNLYLAKIAMDVEAKHIPADKDGVRIAELTERSYREKLWDHRPLRDFWRVGAATEKKLAEAGIYTMGDIARCSLGKPGEHFSEDLLYRLFGVNAELLIDHAWGWEPVTLKEIKAYEPEGSSLSEGQVLSRPYTFREARNIVREMTENLAYALFEKKLTADQVVLNVIYDTENLRDPEVRKKLGGLLKKDRYGREMPKEAHGSENLAGPTNVLSVLTRAMLSLYDRIVSRDLTVRRIYTVVNHVGKETETTGKPVYEQLSLFDDPEADKKREKEAEDLTREKKRQEAVLEIRKRYGQNAILKGADLLEGATAKERNREIGGHRA